MRIPVLVFSIALAVSVEVHAQCERVFADATRYGIPAPTRSILAYDLDADSRPDILAAIPGSTAVAVLMNRSDGFHAAPAIPLPHRADMVKFADVDGDSVDEILAIGPAHVSTLFANGNGTFRVVSTSLNVTLDVLTASRVATGDLTGDGKLDLIGFNDRLLYAFAGDGAGTFTRLASNAPLPARIRELAVGELTGDTKADLVVSTFVDAALLPSNGDGTFGPRQVLSTGGQHQALVADLDRDGRADMMIFGLNDAARGTYLSSRAGQPPLRHSVTQISHAADLDGDGDLDLAAGMQIHRGAGDGTFTAAYRGTGKVRSMASADFDGDGRVDLAYATPWSDVAFRYGRGDLAFDGPASYFTSDETREITTADFNADGLADIVAMGFNVNVFHGRADASLQKIAAYSAFNSGTVAVADFNRDSFLDLFMRDWMIPGAAGGTFNAAAATHPANLPRLRHAAAGDFDGDGHIDVAALHESTAEAVVTLRGDGTGNLALWGESAPVHDPHAIAVADFDADGVSDVLTSGQEADERWTVRLQRGVRGTGLGTSVIVAENVGSTSRYERSLAVGDVDGDGKLDFVVPDASERNLLLFRGAGNGSFTPPRAIPIEGPENADIDASRIAIADVTGDSRADLVVDGESFIETAILVQQSDGTFVERFRLPTGGRDVAARDVNGDGVADVIVGEGTQDGSEVVVYYATCAESLRAVPPAVRLLAAATVPEKKTVELSVVLDAPDAAGTVCLVEDHYYADSSRVLATATVSGGRAHFFTSTLSRGTHRLKAVYSGDGRLARAVSPVIQVVVTEAPPTGPRRRSVRR
jgi:hypothetical protein